MCQLSVWLLEAKIGIEAKIITLKARFLLSDGEMHTLGIFATREVRARKFSGGSGRRPRGAVRA